MSLECWQSNTQNGLKLSKKTYRHGLATLRLVIGQNWKRKTRQVDCASLILNKLYALSFESICNTGTQRLCLGNSLHKISSKITQGLHYFFQLANIWRLLCCSKFWNKHCFALVLEFFDNPFVQGVDGYRQPCFLHNTYYFSSRF